MSLPEGIRPLPRQFVNADCVEVGSTVDRKRSWRFAWNWSRRCGRSRPMWSERDDVTFANSPGPPAKGYDQVCQVIGSASALTSHVRHYLGGRNSRPRLPGRDRAQHGQARGCRGEGSDHSAGNESLSPVRRRLQNVHRHADPLPRQGRFSPSCRRAGTPPKTCKATAVDPICLILRPAWCCRRLRSGGRLRRRSGSARACLRAFRTLRRRRHMLPGTPLVRRGSWMSVRRSAVSGCFLSRRRHCRSPGLCGCMRRVLRPCLSRPLHPGPAAVGPTGWCLCRVYARCEEP